MNTFDQIKADVVRHGQLEDELFRLYKRRADKEKHISRIIPEYSEDWDNDPGVKHLSKKHDEKRIGAEMMVLVEERRELLVSEEKYIKAVEKAILQSNIGINPTNDGQVIRLVFPVMTEERRKELVKQIKKMGEDAKVQVRNQRRDAMDVLKKMKIAKQLSEDMIADCEAEVEKTVTGYMSTLENIISSKEKELMSI